MLRKEAIAPVQTESKQFLSSMFLVPKKVNRPSVYPKLKETELLCSVEPTNTCEFSPSTDITF